jgi:hypothetical protein
MKVKIINKIIVIFIIDIIINFSINLIDFDHKLSFFY